MNIFILLKYSQAVRYRDIDLDGNLLNSLYTSRGEGYRVDYGTVDYTEECSNIKQKSISTVAQECHSQNQITFLKKHSFQI